MYLLVSGSKRIGVCEHPHYIYLNPSSGCFIEAKTPDQRQGIAFNSTPYNLPGHTEIFWTVVNEDGIVSKETAPEMCAYEVDGGEMLFDTAEDSAASLEAVTELYEALIEKGVL